MRNCLAEFGDRYGHARLTGLNLFYFGEKKVSIQAVRWNKNRRRWIGPIFVSHRHAMGSVTSKLCTTHVSRSHDSVNYAQTSREQETNVYLKWAAK
jgi:hypothetical protein